MGVSKAGITFFLSLQRRKVRVRCKLIHTWGTCCWCTWMLWMRSSIKNFQKYLLIENYQLDKWFLSHLKPASSGGFLSLLATGVLAFLLTLMWRKPCNPTKPWSWAETRKSNSGTAEAIFVLPSLFALPENSSESSTRGGIWCCLKLQRSRGHASMLLLHACFQIMTSWTDGAIVQKQSQNHLQLLDTCFHSRTQIHAYSTQISATHYKHIKHSESRERN